jgi:hypothetical protein
MPCSIFLRNVQMMGQLELAVDYQCVADRLRWLLGGWQPGPKTLHGDLWGEVAALHDAGRMQHLLVRKVKAHLDKATATAAGTPALAWEANRQADILAGEAATRRPPGTNTCRTRSTL